MKDILVMLGHWQLDVNNARQQVYRAPTPRERERWHALWLLVRGWSAAHGAEALGRDAHTTPTGSRASTRGSDRPGFRTERRCRRPVRSMLPVIAHVAIMLIARHSLPSNLRNASDRVIRFGRIGCGIANVSRRGLLWCLSSRRSVAGSKLSQRLVQQHGDGNTGLLADGI